MGAAVAPLPVVDVPRAGRGDEVVGLSRVILKAVRKRREGTERNCEDSAEEKDHKNSGKNIK